MPQGSGDLVVLMGPAGAGKSTIGLSLAACTGWPFLEGDDYHPPENKKKQASGIPLTDMDRSAWIDQIINAVKADPAEHILLACSALTPYVQDRLRSEVLPMRVRWVLLLPSKEELQKRLELRQGHFMPASLLADQLKALSPPEDAISIDSAPADILCNRILERLKKLGP